jgi:hypothetical protein
MQNQRGVSLHATIVPPWRRRFRLGIGAGCPFTPARGRGNLPAWETIPQK